MQAVNPEDEESTLNPPHVSFRLNPSYVDSLNSNSLCACLPIRKMSDKRIVGAFIQGNLDAGNSILELAVSTKDENDESASTSIKRCTSEF